MFSESAVSMKGGYDDVIIDEFCIARKSGLLFTFTIAFVNLTFQPNYIETNTLA